MYSIEWTKTAVKQLRKIQPDKQRKAIFAAVDGLKDCPTNASTEESFD